MYYDLHRPKILDLVISNGTRNKTTMKIFYYYNIWDDLPYPMWNEPLYESCDLIMNISKQTHNIVQNVSKENQEQIGILLMFHTE